MVSGSNFDFSNKNYANKTYTKVSDYTEIKSIKENHYGGLFICNHNDKYYWMIRDFNNYEDIMEYYQEIPKELYYSILAHEISTKK
jgi:hypothetical protein